MAEDVEAAEMPAGGIDGSPDISAVKEEMQRRGGIRFEKGWRSNGWNFQMTGLSISEYYDCNWDDFTGMAESLQSSVVQGNYNGNMEMKWDLR